MAIGDISAQIDFLVYKGPAVVNQPKIAHAIGDIYVAAYQHDDGTGYIDTITIDSAGQVGAASEDSLQFDAGQGREVAVIKVGNGVVAVVYRGPDQDGFIKTIGIQADGTITGVIGTLEFDTTEAYDPEIINRSGTIYAIVYEQSTVRQGVVKTVSITAAGAIGAVIDTIVFDAVMGYRPEIIHLVGDICIVGASGNGTDGWLYSMDIDSSGNIGSIIDSAEFDPVRATEVHLCRVADAMIAVIYRDQSSDGWLRTWGCDAAGNLDAAETDSLEVEPLTATDPYILPISDNVFAIVLSDSAQDMDVKTYPITDAGAIGANIGSREFGQVTTTQGSLLHMTGEQVYILSSQEGSRNGVVRTMTIEVTIPPSPAAAGGNLAHSLVSRAFI